MTTWIDFSSEISPPRDRPLIAYCPEFCYFEYHVVMWRNGFFENETHGSEINQYVQKWALFMEAD